MIQFTFTEKDTEYYRNWVKLAKKELERALNNYGKW